VYDCPTLNANIGDACNDGNPNTINDTVQSDCSCAGTPVSSGCNVTYNLNGNVLTINNVVAPLSSVKVFNQSFTTLFACDDWSGGNTCNATRVTELISYKFKLMQIGKRRFVIFLKPLLSVVLLRLRHVALVQLRPIFSVII